MEELIEILKEYLKHPSEDGHPIRRQYRKMMKDILESIE